MNVTYDTEAEAMYFKFSDRGKDGYCEELIEDVVILDRNKGGEITGIEILNVEKIEDITRINARRNHIGGEYGCSNLLPTILKREY